jgi:valyl-tRNA synthetase
MRLLHPWMPFITEEIWQNISERTTNDSICIAPFPKGGDVNTKILEDFAVYSELVSTIRNTRNAKQVSPKEALSLNIKTDNISLFEKLSGLIKKMGNISEIAYNQSVEGVGFVIGSDEFTLDLGGNIDIETERKKLNQELDYIIGFKKSTEAKLSNERFVANAKPELVERERQKLADADAKIKALEDALKKLG